MLVGDVWYAQPAWDIENRFLPFWMTPKLDLINDNRAEIVMLVIKVD